MALINTTTTGIQGTTIYADGTGDLTIQQNGAIINKVTKNPTFRVYLNTNTNTTDNVITKVPLNVKVFDTENCFDITSNYRFTPTVAGYYQINGATNTINSNTRHVVYLYKNGSVDSVGNDHSSDSTLRYLGSAVVSNIIYFNGSTDYVELYIRQTGGTGVYGSSTGQYTWMSGTLIRAA
jgi:hypothetical protein